jgi:hypothetical protein
VIAVGAAAFLLGVPDMELMWSTWTHVRYTCVTTWIKMTYCKCIVCTLCYLWVVHIKGLFQTVWCKIHTMPNDKSPSA